MKPTMLDLRGMRCPLPLLHTKRALHKMQEGEAVLLMFDDPSSMHDIPAWLDRTCHRYEKVKTDNDESVSVLRVEKRESDNPCCS